MNCDVMRSLTTVMVFFTLFITASCISDDSSEIINHINIGDSVPKFSIEGVAGGSFNSTSFTGKRSLLVLFVTTCPDCQRELPVVNRIYDIVKDNPDILVLGISRGEDRSVIQEYWADAGFSIPAYLDPDRSVFDKFANSTIPRIYIIDENGIVEWMAIEKLEITEEALLAKLLY